MSKVGRIEDETAEIMALQVAIATLKKMVWEQTRGDVRQAILQRLYDCQRRLELLFGIPAV